MTMKDARDYVAQVRAAPTAEARRDVVRRHNSWVAAGAKAQGAQWQAGAILFPVGAFGAILMLARGMHDWPLYGLCAVAAGVGLWCFRTAARRERDWRRANPFTTWKP